MKVCRHIKKRNKCATHRPDEREEHGHECNTLRRLCAAAGGGSGRVQQDQQEQALHVPLQGGDAPNHTAGAQ